MMVNRRRRQTAGFTLVEILVVVLVISILLSIGLSVGNLMMKKSAAEQTRMELELIADAILTFKDERGAYPTSLAQLLGNDSPREVREKLESTKGLIDGTQFKDKFEQPIVYSAGKLTSYGPDGKPGGGDDIVVTVK